MHYTLGSTRFALRNPQSQIRDGEIMFKNNLKIAFRHLVKHKTYSLINISGMAVGLVCALLIYLWVDDELRVDKFNDNDSPLFQVMQNVGAASEVKTLEWIPYPVEKTLVAEMPEVEYAVSVMPPARYTFDDILAFQDTHVRAKAKFASKDFFNVFSYHLLRGDKSRVLEDKHAVVISEELAGKLFQSPENSIGKTVAWSQGDGKGDYIVSGVFKKMPANATIQFDLVFNFEVHREKHPQLEQWSFNSPNIYLVLKAQTNIERFSAKIKDVVRSRYPEGNSALFLRKYSDQYLYANYENGVQSGGRIAYVRLFSMIGIFILLIACINFMNLATAKASRRMKEVGVKKALGVSRKTLVLQYMGEALLMSFLSLAVALGMVELFLPQFNEITGKHLALHLSTNIILPGFGIALLTGLISGSYPALYLSGFNPVTVLKGRLRTSFGELFARRGLVTFQFTVSVILIGVVFVVYKQIKFVQAKDLGFEKDNIIHFTSEGAVNENLEIFLNALKKISGVVNASSMSADLIHGDHNTTRGVAWEGQPLGANKIDFTDLKFNYDFIETLGIEMLAGRSFSRDFGSEAESIILNEEAIKEMGLKDPVGKTFNLWGRDMRIIGVTRNFNFESLYEKVKPCFIRLEPAANHIFVSIRAGTVRETLDRISTFYKAYNAGLPFDFTFLDQDYQTLYVAEQRVSILSRYFAGIAILISCLGLFGLAAFSAERRLKEIGIRKVLGASATQLVALLSNEFVRLVLLANCVALPVSWYMMNRWLQSFAYRIDLGLSVFLISGLLALAIAFLTVAYQAIKAALANPVEALRYE
jgi:ABC-type antimicrobial peptide transport system permease subunit